MRLRFLILLVLILGVAVVRAKGQADRIIVTGPTLDREMVLTRPEIVFPLSFAALEDLSIGPVGAPDDPGELFYELERQFRINGDHFQTFDRSRYYPESGYAFYMGLENGSSEYDGKWFRTRPGARDVVATILDSDAGPRGLQCADGPLLLRLDTISGPVLKAISMMSGSWLVGYELASC